MRLYNLGLDRHLFHKNQLNKNKVAQNDSRFKNKLRTAQATLLVNILTLFVWGGGINPTGFKNGEKTMKNTYFASDFLRQFLKNFSRYFEEKNFFTGDPATRWRRRQKIDFLNKKL